MRRIERRQINVGQGIESHDTNHLERVTTIGQQHSVFGPAYRIADKGAVEHQHWREHRIPEVGGLLRTERRTDGAAVERFFTANHPGRERQSNDKCNATNHR